MTDIAHFPRPGQNYPYICGFGYLLLSLSLSQDPVESSSCLDFYQLVLFYATTGAAVLGVVGVALLIFVKAVKRNEKEERKVKAGSK